MFPALIIIYVSPIHTDQKKTMGASGISKGHKFVNDLALYAIGNIGSKLITFMLVPFYTFFITDPAEFGWANILRSSSTTT